MAQDWSREDFATPRGRKRAARALTWGDHGVLRRFYQNTHEVWPDTLWRTYQPDPAALAEWKKRGIKTVVNLRGPKLSGPLLIEEDACARLGLTLVNLRAYSREAPSLAFLEDIRTLFQTITYPAIIHCKSGADRAGLASVLFLFFEKGMPLDKAMAQLSWKYGHVKSGKTGVIDASLAHYIQYAREREIDLADVEAFFDWARTAYDPVAIKQHFKPAWWGAIMTDILFNRE